jgi:acyl-CoA reductase-like NAD-dependent aldehyde dehydrogenase
VNPADRQWKLLIGGKLVDASDGGRLEVINPATRQVITTIPAATTADVDRAVAAAKRAFATWRTTSASERSGLLLALAAAIEGHGEELAHLDTLDNGTPLRVMRLDYGLAVEQLRYFAGLASELGGDTILTPARDSIDFTVREPFGVVARIVPFNHPLMFAASKLAAPLMAGNTVVLKPSQHTSLSALRLGELCSEVLPPGVVNVLSGKGSVIGDHLVEHPDVPRVALTGSVDIGLHLLRRSATSQVKLVTLELGGKNPIIVFADASPEAALAGVIRGMNFTWQGQSCGSTSRLYVHRSLFDTLTAELAERMAAMTVGDPLDPTTDVGAIVSEQQYLSVTGYIERALAEPRLKLLTGGLGEPGANGDGYFIAPTLFACESETGIELASEEVFGPVLVAMPFDEYDDVIERANGLPLGLTGWVFTRDLTTAMRASRDLEAGYVWVNWSSSHIPGTPFGGVKNSGLGREEGRDELRSYTQEKNVYINFEP